MTKPIAGDKILIKKSNINNQPSFSLTKDDVIVGLLSKPNDIRDRLSAKIINKEIDGYVLDSNAEIEFVVNHRDLKSEKNYPQILAKITMNRV